MAHLSKSAAKVLAVFQKLVVTSGLSEHRIYNCENEARDGTNLYGYVKTYIPWPLGVYGGLFKPMVDPEAGIFLLMVAFGVRHPPEDSNSMSVYQVADQRRQLGS